MGKPSEEAEGLGLETDSEKEQKTSKPGEADKKE